MVHAIQIVDVICLFCIFLYSCILVLLQHGADPNIRNTDGKTALDLSDSSAKSVLTGIFSHCYVNIYKFGQ